MGAVISLLPARLEARVTESWRRLVTRVAADRGMPVEDVDGLDELFWREWAMFLDADEYAAEIGQRQAALRQLMHHDLSARKRDEALATLTAAMPPERFRQHVVVPLMREGWSIPMQLQPRQSPPPDVPLFLARIITQTSAIAGGTGSV